MLTVSVVIVDRKDQPLKNVVKKVFAERPVVGDEFIASEGILEKGTYIITRVIHDGELDEPYTLIVHAKKNKEGNSPFMEE